MNMSWIDWTIVITAIVLIRLVSWKTRSLMRGIADFLSANRLAGRYLLTISGEMGGTGVISLVAGWQAFQSAGFPTVWWALMSAPLAVVFAMTGWMFYRLRETRALTVAQFLEMRYSRRFRVFAGTLCWISGIINFGIFPAVAARFVIYFCGLPTFLGVPGTLLHIPTYPAIMAVDLGLALFFVINGGQVSVMVTECIQGMIACIAYLAVAISVMALIPWGHEVAALGAAPPDASLLNPFHTAQVRDFNVWYYMIGIFISIYGYQTWLGSQGFMTSARTPHEQRMGNLISAWRRVPLTLMSLVLPLAVYTILHLSRYSAQAAVVNGILHHIGNKAIADEMTVPVALAHLLPVGIKGLMATAILFLSFTCHDTYMHSWGSIFVQDILLPARGRPLPPEQHLRWLRGSIFFVAVFAFLFSLLYVETDKILFFFAITGTIWLGGAGAVMIGGLYSRFGTTAGAYVAMISGAVFGIAGLVVPKIWAAHTPAPFPINGQYIALLSSLMAIILYIVVSLATGGVRRPFNLDRMLHRGEFAVDGDEHEVLSTVSSRWRELLGLGREFSRGDRLLTIFTMGWTLGWWLVFIVVSALHFCFNAIPSSFWPVFWRYYILILLAQCVPVIVWFTIGGLRDVRSLFRALETAPRNPLDDGRVEVEPPLIIVPDPEYAEDLVTDPMMRT